jgi:prepilin-type N-terminal cleavage/methylation domain-containing protein
MRLRIADRRLLIEDGGSYAALVPINIHQSSFSNPAQRRGWSLVEVMVVVTVMSVLIAMTIPSFHRSVEQSRADIAGANLRAIWSAERLYWLENRTYTSDLSELQSLGVLDPTIVSATNWYVYAVSAADATSFTATATRTGSSLWAGQFSIDETGVLSGVVQASGEPDVVPGFQ